MGLDLYIEARIKEKETGRIISSGGKDDGCYADFTKGFFKICWWCGWSFCDMRAKMIEICNSHAGTNYTHSDSVIPIPPSALRAIYAHIVNCCYLPEDKYSEDLPYDNDMAWWERGTDEKMNLLNADKLHDLILTLDEIEHVKELSIPCFLYKEYIPSEGDLKLFVDNPLAYEWEFRIWNSH